MQVLNEEETCFANVAGQFCSTADEFLKVTEEPGGRNTKALKDMGVEVSDQYNFVTLRTEKRVMTMNMFELIALVSKLMSAGINARQIRRREFRGEVRNTD
jgi:hypothetical protein